MSSGRISPAAIDRLQLRSTRNGYNGPVPTTRRNSPAGVCHGDLDVAYRTTRMRGSTGITFTFYLTCASGVCMLTMVNVVS